MIRLLEFHKSSGWLKKKKKNVEKAKNIVIYQLRGNSPKPDDMLSLICKYRNNNDDDNRKKNRNDRIGNNHNGSNNNIDTDNDQTSVRMIMNIIILEYR